MANKTLIEGEKGLHGDLEFKGELITKPMEKAMEGYIKNQELRSQANAKRAADVKKRQDSTIASGSFSGVSYSSRIAGQVAIKDRVESLVLDGDYTDEEEQKADNFVARVNSNNERWLKQNKDFLFIVDDGFGNIDPEHMPKLSAGVSQTSVNDALAIFGDDDNAIAHWNDKSGEYDYYIKSAGSTSIVTQSEILNNIFAKNDKFSTMIHSEALKQATTNMKGNSRHVDYNKVLNTKAEIVSGFHDEGLSGVPSVAEHLGNPNWANVDKDEFDIKKVKEATITYYNSVLASEQVGFQVKKNADDIKKKLKKKTDNPSDMDIFYKQTITDNVNGDFTGSWGDREVRKVEWRKSNKKSKDPRLTHLWDVKLNSRIGTFNYKDNPIDKPYIYTAGNTHFFFDPYNPLDLKRFSNKLKQVTN